MEYTLTADAGAISFAPSSVLEEVLQNVRLILATRRGSVPLDRAFGVSWDFIDDPLPVARAKFLAEAAEAIGKYEPRAKLLGVDWGRDASAALDGILKPSVRISVDEALAESAVSSAQEPSSSANAETGSVSSSSGAASAGSDSAMLAALSRRVDGMENRLSGLHELEATVYEDIYNS